jgi:SET domain-containing protein
MGLRWINHSRTPNATITKKDGKLRIVALRTIPAGTEITVDYRNPLNPFRKKYAFSL